MRFIGDVHGHYGRYRELIRGVSASIQVGDMGIGFRRAQGPNMGEVYGNPPHYAMVQGDHRFIRGNHDNPSECRKHSQWIPDGHFENEMMFVGGAASIDKVYRVEGYSWWPDEELPIAELNRMIDLYIERKPKVMVTHDCPEEVASAICATMPMIGGGAIKLDIGSRTRQALQSMWSAHSPGLWLFGHWHMSFDHVLHGGRVEGTRFICLAELEYKDLRIEGP